MNNFPSGRAIFYAPAAVLRIEGDDAPAFLQGQCTADLGHLQPGDNVYGLWLNQKGKVVADSYVIRADLAAFILVSYFCPASSILGRLEPYVIADDVTFSDETETSRGLALCGESLSASREALFPNLPPPLVTFSGRRGVSLAWEMILPGAAIPIYREAAERGGLRVATPTETERSRIDAGIPAVPRDLGPADLPQEAGLERQAISFTKGCYLGQEVMARLHAGGQVRRHLRRVRGRGFAPELPAPLHLGERVVGELRSAITLGDSEEFVGLAMLTDFLLGPIPAAAELALGAGSPATITVGEPV